MDETPNDSGASANNPDDAPVVQPMEPAERMPIAAAPRRFQVPTSNEFGEILRRPSVWGLLLLIAVLLIVQVWLLFL